MELRRSARSRIARLPLDPDLDLRDDLACSGAHERPRIREPITNPLHDLGGNLRMREHRLADQHGRTLDPERSVSSFDGVVAQADRAGRLRESGRDIARGNRRCLARPRMAGPSHPSRDGQRCVRCETPPLREHRDVRPVHACFTPIEMPARRHSRHEVLPDPGSVGTWQRSRGRARGLHDLSELSHVSTLHVSLTRRPTCKRN